MTRDLAGQTIAIAGGGLIGLFSAHYMIERGAQVVLMERKTLGSGAARGNGGLLVWNDCVPLAAPGILAHTFRRLFSPSSPFFATPSSLLANRDFLSKFALHCTDRAFRVGLARLDFLNARTRRLYGGLRRHGIGSAIFESGVLRVFSSRAAAARDRALVESLVTRGLGVRPGPLLGIGELREFEPALGGAARWGYVHNGEAFADPSLVVDELIASLRRRGAQIVENSAVSDVVEDRKGVMLLGEQGELRAHKCLVATGAWSKQLAAKLGINLALAPGKGYSISVKPRTLPRRALMLADAHVAATPLHSGLIRIAGTMEFDGTYDRFNPHRITAVKAAVAPYLDGIDWAASSDEWVAPRPITPDGVPYIGRVPGRTRVFVAAGHNMLGFSLAPATGEVVAEMMADQASPELLEAFSLDRAASGGWRSGPRGLRSLLSLRAQNHAL